MLFQALARPFGVTKLERAVTKSDFHIARDEEELPDRRSRLVECLLGFPELEQDEDSEAAAEYANASKALRTGPKCSMVSKASAKSRL